MYIIRVRLMYLLSTPFLFFISFKNYPISFTSSSCFSVLSIPVELFYNSNLPIVINNFNTNYIVKKVKSATRSFFN